MCAQPDHDSPCDSRSAECQKHAHWVSRSCSNGRLFSRETQPTSVLPVRLQCFLKIAAVLAVSHQLLDSGAHAASAERRTDVLVYFNYPSRIWQTNPVTNDINTVKFTFETNINVGTGNKIVISGLTGLDWRSGIVNGVVGRTTLPIRQLAGYHDATLKLACGTTDPAAGGTACWSYAEGTLTMTVVQGSLLITGQKYGITFDLWNDRATDQAAPTTDIKIIQADGTAVPAEEMLPPTDSVIAVPIRGVVDGFKALRIVNPVFTTKLASQSSFVPRRRNTITVYLQSNVELLRNDKILITGLAPTSLPEGSIEVTGTAALIFANFGQYTTAGSLQLVVTSGKFPANEQRFVVLEFLNINYASYSPQLFISSSGSVYIDRAEMERGPGDSAPLFVAGFLTKTIQQSTITTGALNTITVTFIVNRDFELEGAPILTITGLNGTQTADEQPFAVNVYPTVDNPGGFNDLWRSDGDAAPLWRKAGTLRLFPKQKLAKDKPYELSFQVRNAEVGQDARQVSIHLSKVLQELEYNVRVDDFVRETMVNAQGNLAPLKVFDFRPNLRDTQVWTSPTSFYFKQVNDPYVHQSTTSSDSVNAITVTLTPRCDLTPGDAIIISNFAGALQADGVTPLTHTHAGSFSNEPAGNPARAYWNATEESVTVYLIGYLQAGMTYDFRFFVRNPLYGQEAPELYIEVKSQRSDWGYVILTKRRILAYQQAAQAGSVGGGHTAAGDSTPLLVAGFSEASMSQTNQSAGAANQLKLRFVSYTSLDGQGVTIRGLTGAYRSSASVKFRDGSGTQKYDVRQDGTPYDSRLCPVENSNFSRCESFFKGHPEYDGPYNQGVWEGTMDTDFNSYSSTVVAGNAVSKNISVGGEVRMWTAKYVEAGQEIVIEFDVTNTLFGQAPPTIRIQHANDTVSSAEYFVNSHSGLTHVHQEGTHTAVVGLASSPTDTLRIAGFEHTFVKQSQAATFVDNFLTFEFSNFAVLGPKAGAIVRITGLNGTRSSDEDDDSRILYEVPHVEGTLAAAPPSKAGPFTIAEDISEFSVGYFFKLGSDVRQIVSWTWDEDSAFGLVYVEYEFPGQMPYIGQEYSVTADFHKSFGHVAAWDLDAGTLVLTLQADTMAQRIYAFSFKVSNPSETREPATVFIETLMTFSPVWLMVTGESRYAPLFIIGLLARKIGQSDERPGAINTITITFSTTENLYVDQGAFLKLSGLTGSVTSQPVLPLQFLAGPNVSNIFSPDGEWTRHLGELIMRVSGVSTGFAEYIIGFELTNPNIGQASPDVYLEVGPYPFISPVLMEKGPKNSQPLLVGRYSFVPKIGQSSAMGSNWAIGGFDEINTMTVTFSTNVWLRANCTLTVTGILPTIQTSGTLSKYVTHGIAIETTTTVLSLDARSSNVDDAYTGNFIRVRDVFREIAAYMGAGRVVSLVAALPFVALEYIDRYVVYSLTPQTISLPGIYH